MILFAIAAVSMSTLGSGIRPPAWQREVGHRFVKAVKGDVPYQDADFVKPLVEGDREALTILQNCRLKDMITPAMLDSHGRFKPLLNEMLIEFDCKTKRRDGSVGVTFYFTGNKVSKVETHNFDWIVSK